MLELKLRLRKSLLLGSFLLLCYVTCSSAADCAASDLDCDKAAPLQPTCGMDLERACFQLFESECQMASWACKFERVYNKFALDFCKLPVGFMCAEEEVLGNEIR